MVKLKIDPIYLAVAIEVVDKLIQIIYNTKIKEVDNIVSLDFDIYAKQIMYDILYKYDCLKNIELMLRLHNVYNIITKSHKMEEMYFRTFIFDCILDEYDK